MDKNQIKARQSPAASGGRWRCMRGVALAILLCIIVPPSTIARSDAEAGALLADPKEMARIEAAVDRALEYLTKQQRPDGSWPAFGGTNNGVNAICLLAFLGRGHVPGRGPYQHVVDRAVIYLLSQQDAKGMYRGRMYEHALSTLAMIEAYGYASSIQMRQSAQRAVDLIVKSQSPLGGWRYAPVPKDADLSVTVMQVVALRSALNARLNVPDNTIKKARDYVKRCAHPNGGFSYQPGGGPNMAQSAAGSLSMQLLDAYDDPTVDKGLDFLNKHKKQYKPGLAYFYYMTYYAMQAHFQRGRQYWAQWHPKATETLLETQKEDGSWPGFQEQKFNGKAFCYSTGLAAMSLEVHMHYLPAYQR